MDLVAEHLETAADADDLAAVTQMPADRRLPALLAQPGEVGAHALRAWQDDEIGRREIPAGADEVQFDLGVQAEGVEVGAVAQAGEAGDQDSQTGRD